MTDVLLIVLCILIVVAIGIVFDAIKNKTSIDLDSILEGHIGDILEICISIVGMIQIDPSTYDNITEYRKAIINKVLPDVKDYLKHTEIPEKILNAISDEILITFLLKLMEQKDSELKIEDEFNRSITKELETSKEESNE